MSSETEPTPRVTPGTRREIPHFVAASTSEESFGIDAVRVTERRSNLWLDAWRDLKGRPLFWISSTMIVALIFVALFPWLFTDTPPNNECFLSNSNGPTTAGHPLGFTKQGCDIYSRLLYGASTSLAVGFIVITLTTFLGVVFGAFSGFYGGWVDSVLSRLGDIFFSIPYILAAVVIMSVLSQYRSVWSISLAIGLFAWPATARVLRSEIFRVKNADFVMASTALGMSRFKILLKHVLPNSIAPVIVITTLSLAGAIVAEASLSFLGVGMGSDIMSWGNDINQAQTYLRTAPLTLIYPSAALFIAVFAFISLGELVRDALDPKARAQR
ncbi:MAG TPA: ABC transporter permease [Terrimesophilobacter sp.]|nr:ABC transporter permease [Terrimesophilobacter sp.]